MSEQWLVLTANGLEMSSCDFVGDFGCTDPECWRCHSPLSPAHLRVLAANLATAGMLCNAWLQRDNEPTWSPGCHLHESEATRTEDLASQRARRASAMYDALVKVHPADRFDLHRICSVVLAAVEKSDAQ